MVVVVVVVTKKNTQNTTFSLRLLYFFTSKTETKASAKKAQNGPSTQLIEAASFAEIAIHSKKGEFLSFFSSYQTLTTAENSRSYYARTKLVKKCGLMSPHSC